MRWPCGARDVSRRAEAQAVPDPAAMCRQSLVAPPAPARVSSLLAPCETSAVVAKNVTPPGAARSKPQTPRAERRSHSAVRGDYRSCALHIAHEAMGWLKARRSARPWDFRGEECEAGLRARPRRHNNRAAPARPQQTTGWNKYVRCKQKSRRSFMFIPRCASSPERSEESGGGEFAPWRRH